MSGSWYFEEDTKAQRLSYRLRHSNGQRNYQQEAKCVDFELSSPYKSFQVNLEDGTGHRSSGVCEIQRKTVVTSYTMLTLECKHPCALLSYTYHLSF